MSEPKEIIQVVKKMDRGGVETWLMNVLRNIDRERFHFTFCTIDEEPALFDNEIRSLGGDLIACPLAGGYREFARKFRSILEKKKPDVVHSHMSLFSGMVLKNAAKAQIQIRIAYSHSASDGRGNSLGRQFYRWLMRHYIKKYATHAVAVSGKCADFCFTKDWKNRKNCWIVPCAIDSQSFTQRTSRDHICHELGIPSDAKVIGHVGSFRYAKNHESLLHVFAAMLHNRKDIHLFLVGDGPLKPETESLADELGISDHVTFAGVRDDVPLLMTNLFDLLVFPSRYEGLPVVILESQCAALPCLISDVVPIEATVIEELVKRESLKVGVGVWAERALEILKQPPYDKAEALEQIQKSKFSISSSVNFLNKLYTGQVGS